MTIRSSELETQFIRLKQHLGFQTVLAFRIDPQSNGTPMKFHTQKYISTDSSIMTTINAFYTLRYLILFLFIVHIFMAIN